MNGQLTKVVDKMRLCFGNPSIKEIDEGIKRLAIICRKEFGIPTKIANL